MVESIIPRSAHVVNAAPPPLGVEIDLNRQISVLAGFLRSVNEGCDFQKFILLHDSNKELFQSPWGRRRESCTVHDRFTDWLVMEMWRHEAVFWATDPTTTHMNSHIIRSILYYNPWYWINRCMMTRWLVIGSTVLAPDLANHCRPTNE